MIRTEKTRIEKRYFNADNGAQSRALNIQYLTIIDYTM